MVGVNGIRASRDCSVSIKAVRGKQNNRTGGERIQDLVQALDEFVSPGELRDVYAIDRVALGVQEQDAAGIDRALVIHIQR